MTGTCSTLPHLVFSTLDSNTIGTNFNCFKKKLKKQKCKMRRWRSGWRLAPARCKLCKFSYHLGWCFSAAASRRNGPMYPRTFPVVSTLPKMLGGLGLGSASHRNWIRPWWVPFGTTSSQFKVELLINEAKWDGDTEKRGVKRVHAATTNEDKLCSCVILFLQRCLTCIVTSEFGSFINVWN